jgi:hypothetical protein
MISGNGFIRVSFLDRPSGSPNRRWLDHAREPPSQVAEVLIATALVAVPGGGRAPAVRQDVLTAVDVLGRGLSAGPIQG